MLVSPTFLFLDCRLGSLRGGATNSSPRRAFSFVIGKAPLFNGEGKRDILVDCLARSGFCVFFQIYHEKDTLLPCAGCKATSVNFLSQCATLDFLLLGYPPWYVRIKTGVSNIVARSPRSTVLSLSLLPTTTRWRLREKSQSALTGGPGQCSHMTPLRLTPRSCKKKQPSGAFS